MPNGAAVCGAHLDAHEAAQHIHDRGVLGSALDEKVKEREADELVIPDPGQDAVQRLVCGARHGEDLWFCRAPCLWHCAGRWHRGDDWLQGTKHCLVADQQLGAPRVAGTLQGSRPDQALET